MRVAVTGGTGCLGSPLLDRLCDLGWDVNLLVLPDDRHLIKSRRIRPIRGDMTSGRSLHELTHGCDLVFHLAGKVHSLPRTEQEIQEFYTINCGGTRSLLEKSRLNGVRRVIFYSTVGVYGIDENFHADETTRCRPQSVYAKTKYEAEQLVMSSSENGGPEGVVLRFPVAYGPYDRGNMASLIRAIHGRRFVVLGDGECRRSMVSSRNAAEGAVRAALEEKAANEIFCITDGYDCTMNEVIEAACRALGLRKSSVHVPLGMAVALGKIGDVVERALKRNFPLNSNTVRKLTSSLTFSDGKARRVLGYKPVQSFSEGIAEEVEWILGCK